MPLEPMSLDPSNPNVMVETTAGTSILVLDGVGLEQEGGYHCEVVLEGGAGVMVSNTGSLTYSSEWWRGGGGVEEVALACWGRGRCGGGSPGLLGRGGRCGLCNDHVRY